MNKDHWVNMVNYDGSVFDWMKAQIGGSTFLVLVVCSIEQQVYHLKFFMFYVSSANGPTHLVTRDAEIR